jgi:hypothetical protein
LVEILEPVKLACESFCRHHASLLSAGRHADALVERKYSQFVSVNLDPDLSPRKLYDNNLRRLGVINGPERFNGDVDVERPSSFFWPRPSLSTGIDFDVPVSTNVPEFSFVSVTEDEVFNAVMSIKSNAAGVGEIPLSFIKSLLPVMLGTHLYLFRISGNVGGLCGAAYSKDCCPREIFGL